MGCPRVFQKEKVIFDIYFNLWYNRKTLLDNHRPIIVGGRKVRAPCSALAGQKMVAANGRLPTLFAEGKYKVEHPPKPCA